MDNNVIGGVAQEKCAESAESSAFAEGIMVPIGTMDNGQPFVQDFSAIPHLLICGFSGSGKTSFVQTITTLIASKYTPEKVKYIIFDSKLVDYTAYTAMPHLLIPVISDEKKVDGALSWAAAEIKNRLKQFVECSTTDLTAYNANCEINKSGVLPHIFIILDDFSSINQNGESLSPLMDILKNGRPAGIHMILVTSLTSSKVLAKDILSNVSCRISFGVSSRADSRIAIGQNGAEELRSPGELYFKGQGNLVKCQGSYMPDEDVVKTIKQLQRQNRKSISELGTMAEHIFDTPISTVSDDFVNDPMLDEAVRTVVEAGQASTSLLQRRLRLSYARAGRLIDAMEQLGIVGSHEGSCPRQVLMTVAQWQAMNSGIDNKIGDEVNCEAESSEPLKSTEVSDEEPPDIEMRDFPWFYFEGSGICVSENQIRISKKVMTKYGSGTSTFSFNGKSIAGLTYRRPHMFSHGYIQFVMKPNVNIIHLDPSLTVATPENLPELLKIEFPNDIARTMKSFMIQISDDTGIRLTEL